MGRGKFDLCPEGETYPHVGTLPKYLRTRGEATNILEHHINTGNSPPISVPPYRMSPVKKEILRKEIEDLLEKDIIEECESPYGAPVVLIPKSNNQFRLRIDYQKLNEVTVLDTYPLPRMDDLL
ncbi:retrovirus-related Pol polyprotein from transposon 17.6 [Trichonephila clavipes]|nr:retrovirus-related Pol polyprotein from transposon 17.6 [Trichonephila clavipes]